MSTTLVIIPAFNEEKHIFDLISSIQALYPDFDIGAPESYALAEQFFEAEITV